MSEMNGDRWDERRRRRSSSSPSRVYYPPIPQRSLQHPNENAPKWATGYEDVSGLHHETAPANNHTQSNYNVSDPRLTSMYDTSDPRTQANTAIGYFTLPTDGEGDGDGDGDGKADIDLENATWNVGIPRRVAFRPIQMKCPACHKDVSTTISFRRGKMAKLTSRVFCLVGIINPALCIVPLLTYCLRSFMDALHTCPECQRHLIYVPRPYKNRGRGRGAESCDEDCDECCACA